MSAPLRAWASSLYASERETSSLLEALVYEHGGSRLLSLALDAIQKREGLSALDEDAIESALSFSSLEWVKQEDVKKAEAEAAEELASMSTVRDNLLTDLACLREERDRARACLPECVADALEWSDDLRRDAARVYEHAKGQHERANALLREADKRLRETTPHATRALLEAYEHAIARIRGKARAKSTLLALEWLDACRARIGAVP